MNNNKTSYQTPFEIRKGVQSVSLFLFENQQGRIVNAKQLLPIVKLLQCVCFIFNFCIECGISATVTWQQHWYTSSR